MSERRFDFVLVDNRLQGLPIEYKRTFRDSDVVDSIVVFMPAALPGDREDRSKKYFTRWNWRDELPHSEVLSISDPSLQIDERLNGAWYMHTEYDVISAISSIIREVASELSVPADKICIYGSSLGGFGALSCASLIEGATAIAEVPQTEVQNWNKSAVVQIEELILNKRSIIDFRATNPEQVSVLHRFLRSGLIPPFRIITNVNDPSFSDQLTLIKWCHGSKVRKVGEQQLLISTITNGHQAMERSRACSEIDSVLGNS